MSRETPLACPIPVHTANEPPAQPAVMLAVRLLLEMIGLGAIGWAGRRLGDGGIAGGALAALFFGAAGAAWGALTVPGDPARNPTPVIVVPGWVRLLVELAVFGLAAWALWVHVSRAASESYLTALGVISLVGWDRIWWLLEQRSATAIAPPPTAEDGGEVALGAPAQRPPRFQYRKGPRHDL